MSYALGPVKPWVRAAATEVGGRFHIGTVYGFGKRTNATDHDDGLALDFMTRNGGPLADYVQANAKRLGVTYIIWNQRIWSVARSSEGWRAMADRGSVTANHKDHVHVSFQATAPAGGKARQSGGDWSTGAQAANGDGKARSGGSRASQAAYIKAPGGDQLSAAVQRMVVVSGALFVGVALVAVGVARVTKPARDEIQAAGTDVATLLVPEARAASMAASTAKGVKP